MGERIVIDVDPKTLAAARAAGLDLPELFEQALRRHLPQLQAGDRTEAARQWYEENKEAVDAYNKMIETEGLFSDGIRMF